MFKKFKNKINTPNIIIASRYGRLSNRLLTFSNLITSSLDLNFKIINASFYEYADLFECFSKRRVVTFPCKNNYYLHKQERIIARNFWRLMEICSQKNSNENSIFHVITLKSGERLNLNSEYFINLLENKRYIFVKGLEVVDSNFRKKFDFIKQIFQPRTEFVKKGYEIIKLARNDSNILIGIHARRGDYKSYQNGIWYYSWHFYKKLINHLEKVFLNLKVSFIIFSDENPPNMMFNQKNVIISRENEIIDIFCLSKCDYIAAAPSTFSHMAAILGNVPLYQIKSIEEMPLQHNFKITNKVW